MKFLIFSIFFISNIGLSQDIKKAFSALSLKNYQISEYNFRKTLAKQQGLSAFGLTKLYLSYDYRNLDSAYKFVLLSEEKYGMLDMKSRIKFIEFSYDSIAIQNLKNDVSKFFFDSCNKSHLAVDYQKFIDDHYWSPYLEKAVFKRDSIIFNNVVKIGTSSAFYEFLQNFPKSSFYNEAKNRLDDIHYFEATKSNQLSDYVLFIKKYPANRNILRAENQIYFYSTKSNTFSEFKNFIRSFPTNPNIENAWRKLYELYNLKSNYKLIKEFALEFPDYPFYKELNKDFILFEEQYFPFSENNLFGYMDGKGKTVIEPIYDEISLFQGGVAIVSKNGKIGFINKRNEVVLDFIYDDISGFYGDLAIASIADSFGLINFSGIKISPFIYSDIISLNNFFFAAKDDIGYSIYNDKWVLQSSYKYDEIRPLINGNYLIINKDSIGLLDENFTVRLNPIYEDLALFFDSVYTYQVNGKKGLISINGKILTEAIYDDFSVYDTDSKNLIAKYGKTIFYLNLDGSKFFPTAYEYFPKALDIAKFKNGHAIFAKLGRFGIMNIKAKSILKLTFDGLGAFGNYIPVKNTSLYGFMDSKGKIVYNFEYTDVISLDNDGFLVEKNDLFGFVNMDLKPVLPVIYKVIIKFKEDYLLVSDGNKYGLFNLLGEELLPMVYERIDAFDSNYISLTENNTISYFLLSSRLFIRNQ